MLKVVHISAENMIKPQFEVWIKINSKCYTLKKYENDE